MKGKSVLDILKEMLDNVMNILPKKGKVIVEYESGIPYMALGERELARMLELDYQTIRRIHAKTVSKITRINPETVKRVGRGKLVVESIEDAIKVISLLRQNLFTVKAEVILEDRESITPIDLEKLTADYIKLLSYIESTTKSEGKPLDDKLLKLWIQLATAIELLSGKVNETTAHILQVPFIPKSEKKKETRPQK